MDNSSREKLTLSYHEVFVRNPAGVVVLDHLWTRFAEQQPKQPLDSLHLAFQAGQRSVLDYIRLCRDRLEREQQAEGDDE